MHTVASELTAKGFGPQLLGGGVSFYGGRASRLLDLWLQARSLLAVRPLRRPEARQRDRAGAQGEAREGAADRARPDALARAVRRPDLARRTGCTRRLSTLLHWFAARRFTGLWIMPDEAIYAERAIALYRRRDAPAPARAAAPATACSTRRRRTAALDRHVRRPATRALKPLQALVDVARGGAGVLRLSPLMPDVYALVAAALALASPLLLYSGFVMTEVLFYPLSALALRRDRARRRDGDAARPGARLRGDRRWRC